jgi:hypothetical protein
LMVGQLHTFLNPHQFLNETEYEDIKIKLNKIYIILLLFSLLIKNDNNIF